MFHTGTVSLSQYGGWAGLVRKLIAGEHLDGAAAQAAMSEILRGEATPAQIAGLLVALRMKGETTEELVGLLTAMREAAEEVPLDAAGLGLIDTCGTGGDHLGSINVSTASALVAVGAGARVCKHGNRASSSRCGSADVLEELGVVIDLGPEGVARCVTEVGFGFCMAPRFHPAMRYAGPPRRELGITTVFNFLGPLANPAQVRRQIVGTSDRTMAEAMLTVLAVTGSERAWVVHGHDGMDELSTTGLTDVWELRDGDIKRYTVDPAQLGLAPATLEDLLGGEAAANADHIKRILDGQKGAYRDIVSLNAAGALIVAGMADSLAEGLEMAYEAIDQGLAGQTLERLVSVSNDAA